MRLHVGDVERPIGSGRYAVRRGEAPHDGNLAKRRTRPPRPQPVCAGIAITIRPSLIQAMSIG